jgi:hypothetical protein
MRREGTIADRRMAGWLRDVLRHSISIEPARAEYASDCVNDFLPSNEEMIPKPFRNRNLNELMDKTSAGESKKHTANNRQPRVLKMKFHEN